MTLDRLVRGLAALGDEVTVVRPKQKADRQARAEIEKPFAEWLLPGVALPGYEGLMMGLPALGRLTKSWKTVRPDLVHIATEGPLGWSALGAAAKLGLPISSSFHTNFHQYGDHYGFGAIKHVATGYLRSFHNQTNLTMVPTRQMRAQLAADGFKNLEVISRGVDAQIYSPARRSQELRRSWGAEEADPVFIYVGRLAKEKNIALAVASVLAVQAEHPRARFVLVGDGPARAALQARHPQFIFAGMQRGEALAAHYASGDVFLFPSVTETFGNVVTEALASGLVVVTYDYAAGREHIVHGRNGVLAEFGNAAAYREAVSRISRQAQSWPDIRSAARQTALTITWEAIIQLFRNTLENVAKLPARAGGGV